MIKHHKLLAKAWERIGVHTMQKLNPDSRSLAEVESDPNGQPPLPSKPAIADVEAARQKW